MDGSGLLSSSLPLPADYEERRHLQKKKTRTTQSILILFFRFIQFLHLLPSLFVFLLLMVDLVVGRASSSPLLQVAGDEEE
jgi:hypothetical protein